MKIHDITRLLGADSACWPGDVPYALTRNLRMEDGEAVNLGSITTTLHIGTHVDAPFHYSSSGATIEASDLNVFVGDCYVVDVSGLDKIGVPDLVRFDSYRRTMLAGSSVRLLLRTGGWPEGAPFPNSVPELSLDLPEYLAELGVVLFGLDLPSVDALDSKDLPFHNALGARGIHILESADLSLVEPGAYLLVALPLRIACGDASPVRAVLLEQ